MPATTIQPEKARTPSPANVGAVTKEGGLREIAELREGLQAAESVLVVGGGAVGVETAGYVAATYPEKQVTLVHSGERLLPTYFREGVGNGAVSKLRSLGVRVVFGERVEVPSSFGYGAHIGRETLKGASGEEYTSDVQILATGFTVHSEYIKPLEDLIEEPLRVAGRGFIKVRPTLQIDSDRFPHIFVPGDVNSLPMSAKYGFKAEMQGHAVAGNITKMVQDGFDEAFKNQDTHAAVHEPKLNAWHDMLDAILVPIGPHLGVAQAFKVALGGSWLANFVVRRMKAGDFFLWQKKAMFAGLSK
ncbi:hypothetical protein GQ54DRAFT_338380 [Martensiomyces pterosporus]|nr:hypothetical protein GQ54DRAFT_338380 [Martensiomyces pterosporus]